jgi:hypothetical protein
VDPTTAVRTDTLPAIATVLAPGAFISAPYLWAGLSPAADLRAFLDRHEAITVAAVILLWTIAGFLTDSLASYVEYHLIDGRRKKKDEERAIWWDYMGLTWDKEPVG